MERCLRRGLWSSDDLVAMAWACGYNGCTRHVTGNDEDDESTVGCCGCNVVVVVVVVNPLLLLLLLLERREPGRMEDGFRLVNNEEPVADE